MSRKRILSGNRPTGNLHLGNYVGALKNWVGLQDRYECFFMVADWHALTSDYADPKHLQEYTRGMILDWLSAGLDPNRCTLFIQSKVKQHAELNLLLGFITPLPWLQRCPTYKDQINQLSNKDLDTAGFLGYPTLMAADILLYKSETVPVGEDQIPHVEVCRELARRFNNFYGEVFPEPQQLLSTVPKMLGTDGRKMSKSYDNCIYLTDSRTVVQKKISQMVTDPARIKRTDPGHPEVCSVFDYHKCFNADAIPDIQCDCRSAKLGCVDCKKNLAEMVNQVLDPFREKRVQLEREPKLVQDIIHKGNLHAQHEAEATMHAVRAAMHLPE
jgi:tryptophanyl-tRNA synthetase